MKPILFYFPYIVLFTSCIHTDKKVAAKVNIKPTNVKSAANVQRANDTLAIPNDTVPKIIIPEGTIQAEEE